MTATIGPYRIDPELARLLEQAANAGRLVTVTIDDHRYQLSISAAPDQEITDLWKDYDPEKVRAAVANAAGIFTKEEAEELIRRVYEAREQGSRPNSQP
jgi:hypothetical protein